MLNDLSYAKVLVRFLAQNKSLKSFPGQEFLLVYMKDNGINKAGLERGRNRSSRWYQMPHPCSAEKDRAHGQSDYFHFISLKLKMIPRSQFSSLLMEMTGEIAQVLVEDMEWVTTSIINTITKIITLIVTFTITPSVITITATNIPNTITITPTTTSHHQFHDLAKK
ncbi:hypothetical protein H920_17384 [Fukomys damarensis]|uniref:Uncharacterized protein n=1 Tax=Fukomys damarensis TaxID=885580 RepID=A0A091CSE6_FUKDA|nr:hypothetical protein H920_17384 [Fukomys damarensis]